MNAESGENNSPLFVFEATFLLVSLCIMTQLRYEENGYHGPGTSV